jgi:hypothetical protein
VLAELRRQKLQIRIKQLEALIDRHGLVLAGTHELSLTIFMQLRRHLVEGDSSKDRHRQQRTGYEEDDDPLRDFAAEERGPYLCRLNHFLIVRCQADEIAVIRADDVILTGGSRQRRDAFPILPHAVQIKKTY